MVIIMDKKKCIIGTLKNGLKYYIYNTLKNNNQVTLSLVVKVGSLNELINQNGVAHLLEHINLSYEQYNEDNILFFNKIRQEYIKNFKYNGNTDFNRTIYNFSFSNTNTEQSVENGLYLLKEIINGEMLNKSAFDLVKTDVINEYIYYKKKTLRQLDLIKFITDNQVSTLPIGNLLNIKNSHFEDIVKFYKENYFLSKIGVIIIGNINTICTESFLTKILTNNEKKIQTNKLLKFVAPDSNSLSILDNGINEYTNIRFFYRYEDNELTIKNQLVKYLLQNIIESYIKSKCDLYKINLKTIICSEKIISNNCKFFILNFTIDKLNDGTNTLIKIINNFKTDKIKNSEFEAKKTELHYIIDRLKDNLNCIDDNYIFNSLLCNFLYNEEIPFLYKDYGKIVNEINISDIETLINKIFNNHFKIVINPAKDEIFKEYTLNIK